MEPSTPSRRRLLGLLGASVTGSLAGCSDALPGGEPDTPTETPAPTPTRTVTPTATFVPTATATPTPTPEMVAADESFGVPGDENSFGSSLALSAFGRTAVVGCRGWDTTHLPPNPGVGYVFERDDGTWRRRGELSYRGEDDPDGYAEGDEGSTFGTNVALSADGDRCFVSDAHVGEVYVYGRSGGTFERRATLTLENPEPGFGAQIDASDDGGTVVVVGSDTIEYTGPLVHVFGRSGGVWREEGILTSRTRRGFGFGADVAVSGDGETVLLGAPAADTEIGEESGAAYLYRRNGGEWDDRRTLTPDEGVRDDEFGSVVALSPDGRTALVGGHDRPDPEGRERTTTHVFEVRDGRWRRRARLAPVGRYDTAEVSSAGSAVVGHLGTDGVNGPLASVLRTDGGRGRDAVLVTPTPVEWHGRSVALSADGRTALVGQGGVVGEQDPPAPVYVFDL